MKQRLRKPGREIAPCVDWQNEHDQQHNEQSHFYYRWFFMPVPDSVSLVAIVCTHGAVKSF
jgi:hypothetical protein